MTRREPSFHGVQAPAHSGAQSGTHDGLHIGTAAPAHVTAGRPSRFTRFVSTLQVAGTLIGVPLGLASGYSIYRSNFSVETACQNLRGSIVAMLDKNVDASTRRMLVRKDIDTFEQTCGGVDPDAHAAFKALLADPAVTVPKARIAEPVRQPVAKPEVKMDAKAETKAKPETKPIAKTESKAEMKAELVRDERDAALSDARWLAAVRQALVTHAPERTVAPRADAKIDTKADTGADAAGARAEPLEVSQSPRVVLQPSWTTPAPAIVPQAVADRPVPPAPIPMADGDAPRSGSWIAQIPFVGQVIDRAAQ